MAAMLSQRPAAPQAAPISAADVAMEFTGSLSRQAAAEAAHANPGTLAAASSVTAEFTAWLAACSNARGGVTVLDCTPEDVAVFFESSWLLKHGSMQLARGGLHAAPSYLDSSVSHLSGMFKRLGREGPYSYSHKVRFASFMG